MADPGFPVRGGANPRKANSRHGALLDDHMFSGHDVGLTYNVRSTERWRYRRNLCFSM